VREARLKKIVGYGMRGCEGELLKEIIRDDKVQIK
jgi:hypothetical protein